MSQYLLLTWTLILTLGPAAEASCLRPRDFSNRMEAEKYDACISKEGYPKSTKNPLVIEKTSCLHEKSNLVECRRRELRGESIKPVEVRALGASPTPSSKLNPIGGDVPVDEENEKKKEAAPVMMPPPLNPKNQNN